MSFAIISQKLKINSTWGRGVLIRKRSWITFSSISSRGNINNCLLRENDNQSLPEKR